MKKFVAVVLSIVFVLSLAACGSDAGPQITIDDVTKALQAEDANFTFDAEEKPYFDMIGAEDGWIGYFEEVNPVKVYKFADEKAYKEATENFEILEDMPKVGLFVMESTSENALSIFKGLA